MRSLVWLNNPSICIGGFLFSSDGSVGSSPNTRASFTSNHHETILKAMNTRNVKDQLPPLLAGALAGAALTLCVGAATSSHTAWDYKVIAGDAMGGSQSLENKLNNAAETGWDFVSTAQAGGGWGFVVMRREKK
jgi:hypothetical protein